MRDRLDCIDDAGLATHDVTFLGQPLRLDTRDDVHVLFRRQHKLVVNRKVGQESQSKQRRAGVQVHCNERSTSASIL